MAAKRKKAAETVSEDVSEDTGAVAPVDSESGSEDGSGGSDETPEPEAKKEEQAPYKVAPGASLCTLSGIKVTGDPVFFHDLSRVKVEGAERAEALCEKKKLVKN